MVGWIEKYNEKKDGWLDGWIKNRWMVGGIEKIYEKIYGWLE